MSSNRRVVGLIVAFVGLVVASTACQWNAPRFDIGGAGTNTQETTLTRTNVNGLHELWTTTAVGAFQTLPVTTGSTMFVATIGKLTAFDLGGSAGCAGSPKVCAPIWTASVTGIDQPVVSGSSVFVGGSVFDANGTANCAGSPKVCQPLFTTDAPFGRSVVVGNLLYAVPQITGGLAMSVYDATGTTNCTGSPKVCTPIRTYRATCGATEVCTPLQPVVQDSRVFIGISIRDNLAAGRIAAFDVNGATNCSGSPVVCTPLWNVTTGDPNGVSVAGGVVYASVANAMGFTSFTSRNAGDGSVRWTFGGAITSINAIDDTTVYVAASGNLYAFSTSCTGACTPLRFSQLNGFATGPVVANDVVYGGFGDRLEAFDGLAQFNCGGTPIPGCAPIANLQMSVQGAVQAVVAGKVLYAGNDDQKIHVVGL